MNRRTVLGTAAGLVVLAGCLGDGDNGDAEDAAVDDGQDDPPRLVEDEEFPPVDEPATVPSEPLCGVCNMTPADHPHSNAQAVHEDETRQFFCSPGCLAAYAVTTDSLAETESPIENAWARDANHESLVLASEFYWVLDTDPDRGVDPMRNPLPYEDRDDAVDWVDSHEALEESHIVEFDEITVSDAEEYRAFYME